MTIFAFVSQESVVNLTFVFEIENPSGGVLFRTADS